jgi:hypothetical protein
MGDAGLDSRKWGMKMGPAPTGVVIHLILKIIFIHSLQTKLLKKFKPKPKQLQLLFNTDEKLGQLDEMEDKIDYKEQKDSLMESAEIQESHNPNVQNPKDVEEEKSVPNEEEKNLTGNKQKVKSQKNNELELATWDDLKLIVIGIVIPLQVWFLYYLVFTWK